MTLRNIFEKYKSLSTVKFDIPFLSMNALNCTGWRRVC